MMVEKGSCSRSVPLLPFQQVKFIPENTSDDSTTNTLRNLTCEKLDGIAVRKFYENVISPSTKVKSSKQESQNPRNLSAKKIALCQTTKVLSAGKAPKVDKFLQFAQDGNLNMIENCLKNGSKIDAVDNFGWTALMCSVSANQLDMVKLLLQLGANTKLRNSHGLTALDIARKQNISTNIQNLLKVKIEKVANTENKTDFLNDVSGKELFCQLCKRAYTDSFEDHKRSIAHLFNSGSKPDTSAYYHIPESNKGFQLMLKDGWDKKKGLGPSGEGLKYPIKTILKSDRSCIGTHRKQKAKVTHFQPHDVSAIESISRTHRKPVVLRERTLSKRQKQRIDRKNKQKEIDFRRQFYADS